MKTNASKINRTVRLGAAGLLGFLFVVGVLNGWLAIGGILTGVYLFLTGLTGWCPLIQLLPQGAGAEHS
jgi:Protein of unknown function (DUF2892)